MPKYNYKLTTKNTKHNSYNVQLQITSYLKRNVLKNTLKSTHQILHFKMHRTNKFNSVSR